MDNDIYKTTEQQHDLNVTYRIYFSIASQIVIPTKNVLKATFYLQIKSNTFVLHKYSKHYLKCSVGLTLRSRVHFPDIINSGQMS